MAFTSSDIFEGRLDDTHTERDALDTMDPSQVETAAKFIERYIASR